MIKVFRKSRTFLSLRLIAGFLTIIFVIAIRHRSRIREPV